jgi:WD40 repeat protein
LPPEITNNEKASKLSTYAKNKCHSHSKSHVSVVEKERSHHPLDLNTLKGHGDAVTWFCFTSDDRILATAYADRVVSIFKLDDASSKSFKFLRINMPYVSHRAGRYPLLIPKSKHKCVSN